MLKFLFILFIILFNKNLYASNPDSTIKSIIINDVIITGNNVTKSEIILREIHSKKGTALDLETLQNDVNRLYNLNLFSKVEVLPIPISYDSMKLIFDVQEMFYIIPIPQAGIKEGSIKKFWAGLRLNWRNFRGRNETLNFNFGLGYEPFVGLSYSVPWITDERFSIGGGIKYSRNYNKSPETISTNQVTNISDIDRYSIDNFEANLRVGKKLNLNMSVNTFLNYNYIKLSEFKEGRTASQSGSDNYLMLNQNYTYDSRDLYSYTLSGYYFSFDYYKYGLFNNDIDFNRIKIDSRKFIPIKISEDYSITFANRLYSVVSFGGLIPNYLNEYFGYREIIRGWDNRIMEGENAAAFFAEVRFPVIKPFFIEGKTIPVLKNISLISRFSYKFGLYATVFFDVGGVWDKNNNVFKTRFRNGYGAGLNFILPFNFVGRADVGFRNQNGLYYTQVIFGLDASF